MLRNLRFASRSKRVSVCVLCHPHHPSHPQQPPLLVPDGRCRLSGPAECAINFGERAVWESSTSSRRGAARPADYLGQRAPCLALKLPPKHNAASCWMRVTRRSFRCTWLAVDKSILLSLGVCPVLPGMSSPSDPKPTKSPSPPPHPFSELLPTEQVLTGSRKLPSGSFNCRCDIPA